MASEIRANKQTNRVGLGTVTYTDTGIIVSGIVTANSFKGDGSSLTGIDATALKDTGGAVKIQAQASGAIHSGISTFNQITLSDTLSHSGDDDTKIRFPSVDTISIETGGNEQIRINHSSYIQLYNHIVPNNDSTKDIGLTGTRFRAAYVDTYYGDGSNLTGITGTTINNNADNRVITGSGTANTLEGEANLIYNGTGLGVGETSPANLLHVKVSDAGISPHPSAQIVLERSGTNYLQFLTAANGTSGLLFGDTNDIDVAKIVYDHNIPAMQFVTETVERLRIASNGRINIGSRTTTPDELVHIHTSSGEANVHVEAATNAILKLRSHSGDSTIQFSDASASGIGKINYDHGTDSLAFNTNSNERLRITSAGKVGINSTSPQQALDVKGSINGGSVNQPFLRFHDSAGRQRNTKHYFKCIKGGTTTFDILTVDLNQNFHQALIILYYGARIQGVSDTVTYPVHKIIGVNRFNGGSIQFTSHTVVQNSNVSTHANIDAVATSSTNYRIRLTYSGTAGGSSFCCGSVEIIGVGSGDDGCFYSLAHAHGLVA